MTASCANYCIHPVLRFAGAREDQGNELEREAAADPSGTGDQGHIGLHAVAQQPDGKPE